MCVNFLKENYISVFFVVKLFLYICLDKIEYFFYISSGDKGILVI